jgi:hypothetical protein
MEQMSNGLELLMSAWSDLQVLVRDDLPEALDDAEDFAALSNISWLRCNHETHRMGSGTSGCTRCAAEHGVVRAEWSWLPSRRMEGRSSFAKSWLSTAPLQRFREFGYAGFGYISWN